MENLYFFHGFLFCSDYFNDSRLSLPQHKHTIIGHQTTTTSTSRSCTNIPVSFTWTSLLLLVVDASIFSNFIFFAFCLLFPHYQNISFHFYLFPLLISLHNTISPVLLSSCFSCISVPYPPPIIHFPLLLFSFLSYLVFLFLFLPDNSKPRNDIVSMKIHENTWHCYRAKLGPTSGIRCLHSNAEIVKSPPSSQEVLLL